MDKTKKSERYKRVFEQIKELTYKIDNPVSRMSTIVAVLHNKFEYFFWSGFYLLVDNQLLVGPYQGSVACLKLAKDTGVCWAGINTGETILVPDVEKFPGHIACDSRSRSEIVVPLKNKESKIIGVLDVDSKELNSFCSVDKEWLEEIIKLIYN